MTKEPIMIDGVDVSGCEFFRNDNGVFAPDGTAERTELCYLTNDYCGNSSNCHYKNWQRKEQECEKFKEENKLAKKIITKAVVDFSIEYGTKQYRRLLNGAKLLGIEVQDDR